MRGISGELVILVISFAVWILGTIAERKRRGPEERPRRIPDADAPPPLRPPHPEPGAPALAPAYAEEEPREGIVSDWKPAGLTGPAWTETAGVTLSGAQRRQHSARGRLHLGGGPAGGRRAALERAILLAEVLGPPVALRPVPPGHDASGVR